ncbi:Protein STRUBBELIG-RECEPTOR FAMILY 3 [Glycine soja]
MDKFYWDLCISAQFRLQVQSLIPLMLLQLIAYILHYDPLFFLDGLLVAEIHVEKGGKAFCAMDHSYKKYDDEFSYHLIYDKVLNGANLGGELGDKLSTFVSISVIDLSNNNIGGNIPSSLPVALRKLVPNQFTRSIPTSLSTLIGLTDIHLSHNNLSGELPPSMDNLSPLTTLNVENNQFAGPIPPKLLSIPAFR